MKFSDFGFKKFLNDALLDMNFSTPTKIQVDVIPILKKYKSVIVKSHTGTGKTHSFLLPILNNLDYTLNKVQCLIITPTRELARQIYANIKELQKYNSQATSSLFVGGDDIEKQIETLKTKQPMIVVGTPTRLRSLYEQNFLHITTSNYVVIDECDMIFDLGFIDDVDFLLSKINKQTSINLFSATINNSLKPFLLKYLTKAIFIENTLKTVTNKNIEHILILTRNKENKDVLKAIVKNINPYIALIFVNKKDQINEVVKWLQEFNIKKVGLLHGDLDSRTRTNMQKRIQNMEFNWIIVSDVAARGIDINGVSHVISINLPNDLQYYIHRSGRTGRHNYTGKSYVLFNSTNQHQIEELKAKGINFLTKKLIGDELIDIKQQENKKTILKNTPSMIEEQKILNKFKNKKVKPGYKKKRKAEIDKVKKDIRRKHIKESIKKIKKERYKKRRSELFE